VWVNIALSEITFYSKAAHPKRVHNFPKYQQELGAVFKHTITHIFLVFFFYIFKLKFLQSIFYFPPSTLWLFLIPYLLPSLLSQGGCLHSSPHLTSKLPGPSSLLRIKCIISELTQTEKSSTVCVLGTLYQVMYAVCLVFQCLRDLGGPN
jgi:hypothetical protein